MTHTSEILAPFNAESIARELGGRRYGRNWTAPCPAHDDKRPSLSIAHEGGRLLVHCHAGCSQQAVIAALRGRGLWPEYERREFSPAERLEWARARRAADAEARRCFWWFEALLSGLEFQKAVAAERGDLNQLGAVAPELFRLRSLSPPEVLAEFRRRLAEDCAAAERLIASGRAVQRAIEAVGGMILAKWRRDAEGER